MSEEKRWNMVISKTTNNQDSYSDKIKKAELCALKFYSKRINNP